MHGRLEEGHLLEVGAAGFLRAGTLAEGGGGPSTLAGWASSRSQWPRQWTYWRSRWASNSQNRDKYPSGASSWAVARGSLESGRPQLSAPDKLVARKLSSLTEGNVAPGLANLSRGERPGGCCRRLAGLARLGRRSATLISGRGRSTNYRGSVRFVPAQSLLHTSGGSFGDASNSTGST